MANIDQQACYWQLENCFARKMAELTEAIYLLEKIDNFSILGTLYVLEIG